MTSKIRSWKIVATAVSSGALAAAALGGVALADDDRPTPSAPPAISVEAPLSDADKALVTSSDEEGTPTGAAAADSNPVTADSPVSPPTVASAPSAPSAASAASAPSPVSPVSADSPPSPATPDEPAAADTPPSPETPQTP